MSSSIANAVLIGASGRSGPAILTEFLNSTFNVTVISRVESKAVFPAGVKVVKTDFSPGSLQKAFAGQDAVISLDGDCTFTGQKAVVNAAIATAVVETAPFLVGKRKTIEYLQTKEYQITWTAVVTGMFFDWALRAGILGPNLEERTATVWDDGATPFAGTNLHTIGKALIAILSDAAYEKTKNQYIKIASHVQSQNDVVESLRRITREKWPIVAHNSLSDFTNHSRNEIAKGDTSAAQNLVFEIVFGKYNLGVYSPRWNEALGFPKENLGDTVKAVIEGRLP